ncbi:MAG: hypothetical protein WDW38_000890 [Sanguina aurantia]
MHLLANLTIPGPARPCPAPRDGVNDAPALKKAQIGIAMGLGGSDVAREAADIVLLDDDFSSVVVAIEEGRVIYDNLKKTIAYSLTHSIPEVFPIFLNLAFSFPLGLSGLLLLTIDLITEQGPAISMAYEPAESNVMERRPRNTAIERLVDTPLLVYSYLMAGVSMSWICLLSYFVVYSVHHVAITDVLFANDYDYFMAKAEHNADLLSCRVRRNGEEECITYTGEQQLDIWFQSGAAWYLTLVLCQGWNIYLCKTRRASLFTHGPFTNMVTTYGLLISIATVIIVIYVPVLDSYFMARPTTVLAWLPQFIFPTILLPYTEWVKYLARSAPSCWVARHLAW